MLAEFVYTVLLRPRPLRTAANAVLRRLIPATLERDGFKVALNPNDPVVSGALTLGLYEKAETRFMRQVCRPGLTFLDIGANCGYYTALALSRMAGRGRIVAVEPDPESCSFLRRTVAVNAATIVTVAPVAAAEHGGTVTLFTSTDNRGDNRLYANELATGSCVVEATTIDALLEELGIACVDLVKIDVQGYEAHVMAGMRRTVERSPDLMVLCEYWPDGLRRANSDPAAFLHDLEGLGLRLYELSAGGVALPLEDKESLIRRHPGRRYTNIVAAKDAIGA